MSTIAKITTGLSKLTGRTGLALKAASPEILLYVGIAGSIGATVLACRATLKVEAVLEKHSDQLDKIHTVHEQVQNGEIAVEEYSETDYKKDLVLTYAQTAGGFIKLYGPAVTLGVASFACIIGGHRIMKARNVAIMAAYQAVEKGFAAYRRRVVEEFGENKDYQFKHGLRSEMLLRPRLIRKLVRLIRSRRKSWLLLIRMVSASMPNSSMRARLSGRKILNTTFSSCALSRTTGMICLRCVVTYFLMRFMRLSVSLRPRQVLFVVG